jgi:hypothetical protein
MNELPILPPLTALILFAVWSLLLVVTIGAWRVSQLLTGKVPAGGFKPGTPHGGDAYWRLNRAHMNSAENLPVFGAIVLSGVVLQVQDPLFLMLPTVVIGARVIQSLIHISSGSTFATLFRFSFYLVQVLSMLAMAVCILAATGGQLPL